jgi:8-oxo-dGTP diphosphatase
MPVSDQGVYKDRYMLIPRTLTFLTRGRKVLLLKGAPTKKIWPNLYNGIGGHIECGEDILTSARREIKEETGLTPSEIWLCAVITVNTNDTPGIGIFVFLGECLTGEHKLSPEGILEWVEIDQLSSLPLVEDLPTLLPKVLTHTPKMPPLFAHYSYDEDGKLKIHFSS